MGHMSGSSAVPLWLYPEPDIVTLSAQPAAKELNFSHYIRNKENRGLPRHNSLVWASQSRSHVVQFLWKSLTSLKSEKEFRIKLTEIIDIYRKYPTFSSIQKCLTPFKVSVPIVHGSTLFPVLKVTIPSSPSTFNLYPLPRNIKQ